MDCHLLRIVKRLLLFGALAISVASCGKKSGCTDFSSPNYDPDAFSDDGSCIPVNRKFIGLWDVTSDCDSANFYRSIERNLNNPFEVLLTDVNGNFNVRAHISDDNISFSDTLSPFIYIEGAGQVTGDGHLELSYKITYSGSGAFSEWYCFDRMTLVQ